MEYIEYMQFIIYVYNLYMYMFLSSYLKWIDPKNFKT